MVNKLYRWCSPFVGSSSSFFLCIFAWLIASVPNLVAKELAKIEVPEPSLQVIKHGANDFELKAMAPVHYHFNLKAPVHATISVYLCDDKNTLCVKRDASLNWDPTSVKSTTAQHDEFGFIMNNSEQAIALAKKLGKPLLIDFYALWCPPCNYLDDVTYPSKEFKAFSKNFVLLKLDADAPLSWDLKSKFKVGGYPTIIIAKPDLTELARLEGSFPPKLFVQKLQEATLSIKKKSDTNLSEALVTEIDLAEKENNKEKAIAKKLEYVRQYPTALFTALYHFELGKAFSEKKDIEKSRQHFQECIRKLDRHLYDQSELQNSQFAVEDLLETKAVALDELQDEKQKQATYAQAAKVLQKRIGKLPRQHAKAFELRLPYFLWQSGNVDAAKKQYVHLQKKYPNEVSFFISEARMYMQFKQFQEALLQAQKALSVSYGDNRIRAVKLVAEIQKELGKKKEALDLLRTTLKETVVPEGLQVRTKKLLDELRVLEKQLL